MSVSIEQAVQSALARWLTGELRDVTVWERWPEASVRLPSRAVSVLRSGARHDELLDAEPIARTDVPGAPPRTLYTWRMRACMQPLQLDVWARSDVARDDIMARLEPALSASKARSMPSLHLTIADPVEHELALVLGDGWDGFASYLFDEPAITDAADAVQRCEYRATYRGRAWMQLTVVAESPRIARARVIARLDGVTSPS